MLSLRKVFVIVITMTCVACKASNEPEIAYTAFPTKLGTLELMRPSHDIRLNNEPLLKAGQTTDPLGYRLVFLEVEPSLASSGTGQVVESGRTLTKRQIDRLLVAEAVDGTCARSFFVLDFRSDKPFVSERFGFNPEGRSCLKFKRARWGAKESTIYLDGPLKYIYYTNGKVIGPVE